MWTTQRRPLAALCAGVCLTPLALMGLANRARAQPPAPATTLEQVIVTAEKRTTDLQKAPLAITSLSADTLRQDNINQIDDLDGYVPGLTVAKNEGAERVVAIRGVGYETAENISTQPGVAFHIDGVNIVSTLALNQDFIGRRPRRGAARPPEHRIRPDRHGGLDQRDHQAARARPLRRRARRQLWELHLQQGLRGPEHTRRRHAGGPRGGPVPAPRRLRRGDRHPRRPPSTWTPPTTWRASSACCGGPTRPSAPP